MVGLAVSAVHWNNAAFAKDKRFVPLPVAVRLSVTEFAAIELMNAYGALAGKPVPVTTIPTSRSVVLARPVIVVPPLVVVPFL